jgi:hypothetical protein
MHSALFPGPLSYLHELCNKIMWFNPIGTSKQNIWINTDIRICTDVITLNDQWNRVLWISALLCGTQPYVNRTHFSASVSYFSSSLQGRCCTVIDVPNILEIVRRLKLKSPITFQRMDVEAEKGIGESAPHGCLLLWVYMNLCTSRCNYETAWRKRNDFWQYAVW